MVRTVQARLPAGVPGPQGDAGGLVITSTYTTLRSLYGSGATMVNGQSVYVLGSTAGQRGIFFYDSSDSTTAEDGGVVIVDLVGRRWKREYQGAALARWWGCKGDGVTDDKAAMIAALESGYVIDCEGLTYGISGYMEINAAAFRGVQNFIFKQLNPSGSTIRTLFVNGVDGFFVRDGKVDCGGNQSAGTLADYAGVWITGCDGFRLENVEVTNGGPINGFKIVDCTDFQLDSCRAHHFTYSTSPDPTDDVIQGYHFVRCKRFTVDKCYAHDLIGYISGSLIARYSRGFAFGDCESGTFNGLKIWNVDQGMDASGTDGNRQFIFNGCHGDDCYSAAFKAAHASVDVIFNACIATRAGLWGFVVSGNNNFITGRDIKFIGCTAKDTGGCLATGATTTGTYGTGTALNPWAGSSGGEGPMGFSLRVGATSPSDTYPRGVQLIGCTAIDEQAVPTMNYGYSNTAPAQAWNSADPTTGLLNTLLNCTSSGHITGFQNNLAGATFHKYGCMLTGSGNISHTTSGTPQILTWDTETEDTGAMHSTSANTSRVTVKRPGTYIISGFLAFASNATGARHALLYKNGVLQANAPIVQPVTGTATRIAFNYMNTAAVAGDYFEIAANQSSGGALNVDMTASIFNVMIQPGT